jgi:hypothetical protein
LTGFPWAGNSFLELGLSQCKRMLYECKDGCKGITILTWQDNPLGDDKVPQAGPPLLANYTLVRRGPCLATLRALAAQKMLRVWMGRDEQHDASRKTAWMIRYILLRRGVLLACAA